MRFVAKEYEDVYPQWKEVYVANIAKPRKKGARIAAYNETIESRFNHLFRILVECRDMVDLQKPNFKDLRSACYASSQLDYFHRWTYDGVDVVITIKSFEHYITGRSMRWRDIDNSLEMFQRTHGMFERIKNGISL